MSRGSDLDLHDECKVRLRDELAQLVSNSEVRFGNQIHIQDRERLSSLDESLSRGVRERATKLVGRAPFSSFVRARLASILSSSREANFTAGVTAFSADLGVGSPDELASRLVDEFSSLPWPYKIFIPLALESLELDNNRTAEHELADGLKLIKPGNGFDESLPPPVSSESETLLGLLGANGNRAWDQGKYYLQVETEGFIDAGATTRPIEKALLDCRAFLGLLLSGFLVRFHHSAFPSSFRYSVFKVNGATTDTIDRFAWSWLESGGIRQLKWKSGFVAGGTAEAREKFLVEELERIRFGLQDGGRDSAGRGAQWFFDSHVGEQELLQFVQCSVALEILLGDKAASERIGIQSLLANRAAYLLAQSQEGRKALIERVEAIYDTRSRIVHSGKDWLDETELEQLTDLRSITGQVIMKELDLGNLNLLEEG